MYISPPLVQILLWRLFLFTILFPRGGELNDQYMNFKCSSSTSLAIKNNNKTTSKCSLKTSNKKPWVHNVKIVAKKLSSSLPDYLLSFLNNRNDIIKNRKLNKAISLLSPPSSRQAIDIPDAFLAVINVLINGINLAEEALTFIVLLILAIVIAIVLIAVLLFVISMVAKDSCKLLINKKFKLYFKQFFLF